MSTAARRAWGLYYLFAILLAVAGLAHTQAGGNGEWLVIAGGALFGSLVVYDAFHVRAIPRLAARAASVRSRRDDSLTAQDESRRSNACRGISKPAVVVAAGFCSRWVRQARAHGDLPVYISCSRSCSRS